MKPYSIITAFVLFSCFIQATITLAEPITTMSLIREMIDFDHLTKFPDPSYHTVQFSSYDRRSDMPGGPNWFSNATVLVANRFPILKRS